MKSKLMKGLVIVALAGSLTACEMDRQQRHTATGAAIGGVAGGPDDGGDPGLYQIKT